MKNYIIYYWVEANDVATDREIIIEANNIEIAIEKFKEQVRVYKSISRITETYNK